MTTTFKDTVDRLQATMQKARDEAQNAFLEELKAIFINNPDVAVIKWVQYTPYFNDGDTCEFSVHDIVASNYEEISFWGEYEGDEEPADLQVFNGYGVAKLVCPELQALASFMQSGLGHDVLQFAFGDHVSVTVTAEGVDVDDYDHE